MTVAPTRGRKSPKLPEDELNYPSGDGKPMAENDVCREQAIYCTDTLGQRYANDPMVYVAGNNFIYYKQDHPKQCISPDVYVVFGAEKRPRRSYMAWRENGILPALVIEITSNSTWVEDTLKQPRYEKMGVTEYFQFDPFGDYLYPPLHGFRLVQGRYQRIAQESAPVLHLVSERPGTLSEIPVPLCLRSEVLGLYLVQEGGWMRFYGAATGEPLLSSQERAEAEARRADVEAQRAHVEMAARIQAEAEVVRLRAELEELRRRPGA